MEVRPVSIYLPGQEKTLSGKGAVAFALHLPPPPPVVVKTGEEPGSPQYQVYHPTSYVDPVFVEHQQKVAQALITGELHFSPEQQAAAEAAEYTLPSGYQLSPGMQEAIATNSIEPRTLGPGATVTLANGETISGPFFPRLNATMQAIKAYKSSMTEEKTQV